MHLNYNNAIRFKLLCKSPVTPEWRSQRDPTAYPKNLKCYEGCENAVRAPKAR